MIDVKLDLGDFERMARQVGAAQDQVPFALSQALNESVKVARQHEVSTVWPGHVQARNRSFIGAALRTEFATKRNLAVAVYDRLRHVELTRLETGGTKRGRKGRIAIPDRKVRRTGKGVSAKQRPSALPNSFRKGDVIYQRYGKGGSRLRLMFTLKGSARIRAAVPFHQEFEAVMRNEMRARFGPAIQKAMRTRR